MSLVNYEDERKPWGKIRRYDTSKIPAISFYIRVFAEKGSVVAEPVHSYSDPELYKVISGRVIISCEKHELKLKEGEIGYVPPNETHELFVVQGGIVNVIRFTYKNKKISIPVPQRINPEKLEKELKLQLPVTV